jgi:hypothetical protein
MGGCVDLDVRDGTPVEFECGSDRVDLCRRAVDGAEDIGLVVAVIDGRGIVGLEGWAGLRPERRSGKEE